MTNDQLIDLLKAKLPEENITRLKREASASGRLVEDLIHEWHLLDDEDVAQIKAAALKIPYMKVAPDALTPEVLALIPEETVRNYGLVPLEKRGPLLVAGMVNPDEPKAQE